MLPFWLTLLLVIALGYTLDEYCGLTWWQRALTVCAVIFTLEAVNQGVRRWGRRRATQRG
ncbi:hypothetical protein IAG44_22580 [Streptomyces roseirectus]|uniref:Uncharacterized protein n=1 Tax=Streptomyces roseirectus TaxID=2768066 RepID=A0A7H0IGK7_9ACTN|nr:hypothetical protein [Streptomyces roseirectus]QNP71923.1 hypothetical protein IAG44_22580 [Streptomyces roseirectus]